MCETQTLVGSEVRILSNSEVEGYTRVRGGWNEGEAYTVYFYAEINTSADSIGTWKGQTLMPGVNNQFDSGERTGAYFCYATKENQEIKVRVGISFVSCGKARENLRQVTTWNFDEVHAQVVDKWNRILNKIDVTGEDDDKIKLYTALYHCYLQPTDKTGENPK